MSALAAALGSVFGSPEVFATCCAVTALAQAVYVLLGFGSGLIAVGLLALVLPIRDVVVLELLLNLPAELYVVRAQAHHVAWRRVLTLCAGIALGVPVGTLLLQRSRPEIILVLLGLVLVLVGSAFLAAPSRRAVRWPAWAAPPIGFVSGLLAGTFGTGGPPLILYYQLGGADKIAFRANLMAIFLLVTAVRVPSYAIGGLLTAPRLLGALALVPAVLVGAYLGNRIHLTLSEPCFRRAVCVALILIGALLLLQRLG